MSRRGLNRRRHLPQCRAEIDPIGRIVSLLVRGLGPSAAVASGLFSPLAVSKPGDLDPTFGNVGRVGPMASFAGPAWSIQPLANDEMLFAGGEACLGFYCYFYYDSLAILGRLSDTGTLDTNFVAPSLTNIAVLDVAMQPDGQAVAVGFSASPSSLAQPRLTVFRLQGSGALDATFGDAGIFQSAEMGPTSASSVVLDPDGRIVVAGSQDGRLAVIRLLSNGTFDDSFAASGVFLGPDINDFRGARLRAGVGRRISGRHKRGIRLPHNCADGERRRRCDLRHLGRCKSGTSAQRCRDLQIDGATGR